MKSLLELFSGNNEYFVVCLYVIVAAVIVTFVVNFVARNLKFIKYIPGLLLITIGMFSLFSVINDLFNPDNLNNIVFFVAGCSSGVISLLFALIIGIFQNDF